MMNPPEKQVRTFRESLLCALAGLKWVWIRERHARVHAAGSVAVLVLSWVLQIDLVSFLFVILAIVAVAISEIFNTTLEILADMVTSEYCETAKKAKDIAAGGVLIAAIGAVIIGALVFGPRLLAYVS